LGIALMNSKTRAALGDFVKTDEGEANLGRERLNGQTVHNDFQRSL